jgi:transcriptional regulator with XRE-family HTH domain
MRLSYYSDGMTQADIALKFGKSISVISNVLRGNRKVSVNGKQSLSLKNTSGIKGVSWDKSRQKWKASKKINGKTVNFGRFATKEEATIALNSA